MIQEIFKGEWNYKIILKDIPELLFILVMLPLLWLFTKFEDFLSLQIIDLTKYDRATSLNKGLKTTKSKKTSNQNQEKTK